MIRIAAACVLMVFSASVFSQVRPATRPGGPRVPESIAVERDVNYAGTKNPAQSLDVFSPKKPGGDKPLPAIINIHGGAFMAGDKSGGLAEIIPLVASGDYVGVSINYRLSGEAIWPAQIHDCKAAVRWVRANAKKYNIDPDRIGVIGASAGGHLVAMLGLTNDDKAMEGEVGPHKDVSSRVQCVIDQFGPVDFLTMGAGGSTMDHDSANSPESRLIGGAVQENKDKARAASPINYVTKDAPPFLILHGDKDPLVPHDQSVQLDKKLKAAGVEAYFVTVTGAGHGGFRNPEVAKRIRAFCDRILRGQSDARVLEEAIPNNR